MNITLNHWIRTSSLKPGDVLTSGPASSIRELVVGRDERTWPATITVLGRDGRTRSFIPDVHANCTVMREEL